MNDNPKGYMLPDKYEFNVTIHPNPTCDPLSMIRAAISVGNRKALLNSFFLIYGERTELSQNIQLHQVIFAQTHGINDASPRQTRVTGIQLRGAGSELIDGSRTDDQNRKGLKLRERFMTEPQDETPDAPPAKNPAAPCCPVCGGELFMLRAKLQCSRCHTICETCCEGDRG